MKTILLEVPPLGDLGHTGQLPELIGLRGGVLQALFHLDSLVGLNPLAHDGRVAHGGIKGLVPPALNIVHILADDPPILLDEGGFPEDSVGMAEAVQNESGFVSASALGSISMLNAGGLAYS